MMTAISGKFLPSPNPAELAENGPNRHQNITDPSIRFYSNFWTVGFSFISIFFYVNEHLGQYLHSYVYKIKSRDQDWLQLSVPDW